MDGAMDGIGLGWKSLGGVSTLQCSTLAHLCHLGGEIKHTVGTPYMGVWIVNGAAGAKIDQFGPDF